MNINSITGSYFGKNINRSLSFAKNAVLAATLSTSPVVTARTTMHDIPKMSIYEKKNLLPNYLGDHPSFYMFDAARKAVQTDINTGLFNRALRDNKKTLMKELKINSKTYDSYVELTKAIGQEERTISMLDDPGCYDPYDIVNVFAENESETGDVARSLLGKKLPYYPLDIERFKVTEPTAVERLSFAKHGIDFSDKNISPEKRAIATIIHLSTLEKDYPNYLKELSKVRPDYNDKSVQNSIKNAQRIMADEVLAPFAIVELDAAEREMSYIMGDIGELNFGLLSKKDLEDLRIYAKSIVLSKDVYLLERWDNHPIIPAGDKKDSACANLLSLLLKSLEK